MGHRRQRKQIRKFGKRGPDLFWTPEPSPFSDEVDSDFAALIDLQRSGGPAAFVKACGNCREFVEDQEGGRGTCLHPGSGILSPWTDTEACQFHARIRGAALGR